MDNGWIKLHRKLHEKGYWNKSQYVHLWIHLLLSANHKPREYMTNGQIILIKEGQLLTGRKQLSQATGIPESTIEDILKVFESEHQIQQQKTSKYRLITIVNWKDHQESDSKATTGRQLADTNKNDKKEKKISETVYDGVHEAPDEEPTKKEGNQYTKKYNELCSWLEELNGVRMVDRRGQFRALKLSREAAIPVERLKERALEMKDSGRYEQTGFDWFTVVYSFNKKA